MLWHGCRTDGDTISHPQRSQRHRDIREKERTEGPILRASSDRSEAILTDGQQEEHQIKVS